MSIVVYYTKLKALWDELASFNSSVTCTCGAQNDCTKLMQFLMGLNESYSRTRGQILLMNPLPSIRQAYASVAQEENQSELGSSLTLPSNKQPEMCVAVIKIYPSLSTTVQIKEIKVAILVTGNH